MISNASLSTITLPPSLSNNESLFSSLNSDKSVIFKSYWNPWHPPDDTTSRRARSSLFSSSASLVSFLAADSVSAMWSGRLLLSESWGFLTLVREKSSAVNEDAFNAQGWIDEVKGRDEIETALLAGMIVLLITVLNISRREGL